jgi:hypothetical protein
MKAVIKKNQPAFWITNITNRNVSLADLNLTIKAFTSINLLDNKHYYFTEKQLLNSAQQGSLFVKRNKVVVRQVAPGVIKEHMPINRDAVMPSRERSVLVIKDEKYEELQVSDEQFALESTELEENADKIEKAPK